jgi:alpha-D-xyloside xylohydrolase
MLGPDLLVAPVLEPGPRTREVYVPRGAKWTEVWTGEVFSGGRMIRVSTPLDRIGLLVRDDAQLPILP